MCVYVSAYHQRENNYKTLLLMMKDNSQCCLYKKGQIIGITGNKYVCRLSVNDQLVMRDSLIFYTCKKNSHNQLDCNVVVNGKYI